MSESIFSKILRGEIPCYKVYEDDHALAFLDVHPHAKGHTLVIPKVAAETIFELPDDETGAFMMAVKRTMERLKEVLHPDGFTVGWNHGEAGGQAVPHLHAHIFPRWHNDGGTSMHAVVNTPGEMSPGELAKLFQ